MIIFSFQKPISFNYTTEVQLNSKEDTNLYMVDHCSGASEYKYAASTRYLHKTVAVVQHGKGE